MTKQDDKVKEMERELLRIQDRAQVEMGKGWMTDKEKVENLRADYKRLHARWKAAKAQTAMDV